MFKNSTLFRIAESITLFLVIYFIFPKVLVFILPSKEVRIIFFNCFFVAFAIYPIYDTYKTIRSHKYDNTFGLILINTLFLGSIIGLIYLGNSPISPSKDFHGYLLNTNLFTLFILSLAFSAALNALYKKENKK